MDAKQQEVLPAPSDGNHRRIANAGDEDDDEPLALSAHALEALREFLIEQSGAAPTAAANRRDEEVSLLSENWNLSQFWYSPETALTVAEEVLHLCDETDVRHRPAVACIACPTLFAYLKKKEPDASARLLEYDKRFEQYGSDFTFYDYDQPEDLPPELKHSFHVIVADPPYLSKECLEKVAQTVAFLANPGKSYLMLLTGEVQTERAAEFLGAHPCGFRPHHTSKLGNEFRLFTNYDPGQRLGGWQPE